MKIIDSLKIKKINKFASSFFYLGVFFLSTALPISGIFFLVSILFSFQNHNNIFKDKYNYFLFLCSGLMLFKNINLTFSENIIFQNIKSETWIDLINWLPFFFIFIYFQSFIENISQRRLISKILIASLIPVLFSCFLQLWFSLYGPFETLNGLIVWFQKPIMENHGGVTGLFNNQNYTGLWITATIPLLIAEFKLSNKNKVFLLILILISIYFTFLTTSKNAILGLFIIFIFLFEWKRRNLLIISLISFSVFITTNFINKFDFSLIEINANFIPQNTFKEILKFNFFDSSRFEIYKKTILFISQRPFSGWSKSLFYEKFKMFGNEFDVTHTHSMPLELAFNYGIPVALLLITFVFLLLLKSIKLNKNFYSSKEIYVHNKAWILSTVIIVISHISDITYYDGKISILIWLLLSGLRSMILDRENIDKINNNVN